MSKMFAYLVGVGKENFTLEKRVVYAENQCAAYYEAVRQMIYNQSHKEYTAVTEIKRLKRADVEKYKKIYG